MIRWPLTQDFVFPEQCGCFLKGSITSSHQGAGLKQRSPIGDPQLIRSLEWLQSWAKVCSYILKPKGSVCKQRCLLAQECVGTRHFKCLLSLLPYVLKQGLFPKLEFAISASLAGQWANWSACLHRPGTVATDVCNCTWSFPLLLGIWTLACTASTIYSVSNLSASSYLQPHPQGDFKTIYPVFSSWGTYTEHPHTTANFPFRMVSNIKDERSDLDKNGLWLSC